MTPYLPRPIRFLNLWEVEGWRIKLYGIAYDRPSPCRELVESAKRLALEHLRALPANLRHYQLGFLGVHEGKTANFVFFDYWAEENELHHHVYVSPTTRPTEFVYATPTGLSACVWDLRLQAFERDAWVSHVLKRAPTPDFDAYLADTFNADV